MNQKFESAKFGRQAFGFTLTEILMVIVILGIMSAVALPRFAPQREKAFIAEAVGVLSAIRQAQEAYRLETGVYLTPATAADWEALGMENPDANDGALAGRNYWNYAVAAAAGPIFTATATRTANNCSLASNACNGLTVTLANTGAFGGNHPNRPR